MNDLVVFKELNVMELFTNTEQMDELIEGIKKKVAEFSGDMSTPKGRKKIASFAHDIAKSKSAMDKSGKDLTEDVRGKIKLINGERSRVKDILQGLQDSVRQPLTEWEDTEKERVDAHEKAISMINELSYLPDGDNIDLVKSQLCSLEELHSRDWQEFKDRAEKLYSEATERLRGRIVSCEKRLSEWAELEKLRVEKEEREQKERDERLAKEAAERATKIAERKAEYEKAEVERKAEEERQAVEQARIDAENKVISDKKEAERKAQEEKDLLATQIADAEKVAEAAEQAAKDAEEDRKQSKLDNEKRVEAAAQVERDRAQKEKDDQEAAALLREQDKAHKRRVNNLILKALVANGIDDGTAKEVISLIAKNLIPDVKISY